MCLVDLGLIQSHHEHWEDAYRHLHQGLGILQPLSMSEYQRAIAVEGLANVGVATGQAFAAMRLLGAIDAWQGQSGMIRHRADLEASARTRRMAQSVLGNERTDAALHEGQQLSLEEAIALALALPDPQAMEAS
jgi:hypothetical protein